MLCYAKNPFYTFPRKFPVDGEEANLLRTCCGLVSDMANKSATSRCNGIWEMTRLNRHNGLLSAPTCYELVTDLLRSCRLCCALVVDLLRASCQLVTELLRGNWCNGFWPLIKSVDPSIFKLHNSCMFRRNLGKI